MSLPQCIEGCPQHETWVRHKQRHRSRKVSKTSLRGEAGYAHASPGDFGEGCAQHEGTQPLTLLPHKTRSKLSRSGQVSIQQIQDLRGGRGVHAVQGCVGGVQGACSGHSRQNNGRRRRGSRGSRGGPKVLGGKRLKTRTRKTLQKLYG